MMPRTAQWILSGLVLISASTLTRAQDSGIKGVKDVTLQFEPAQAKPGQVVTAYITVELLDGFHTYPIKQTDKNAESMINRITYPGPDVLIFVGETKDPENPTVKSEPLLGIKELKTFAGQVVYERKAIVSPKATAGDKTVSLKSIRLTICDDGNCYPPKNASPEGKLTVLAGPAVAIPTEFEAEVQKALVEKK